MFGYVVHDLKKVVPGLGVVYDTMVSVVFDNGK